MKRLAVVLAVAFLATGVAFAESASIPTSEIPEVIEKKGGDAITLEASYYPVISVDTTKSAWVSDDCYAKFDKWKNTLTPIDSKAPLFKEAATGETFQPKLMGMQPISDLQATISILPAHQKTAKILVFWTVRVTGECVPWRIDERVCDTFEATAQYTCSANNVNTYVKVNDKLMKNNQVTLQIPAIINGANEQALYDPTITGTYVITKDDFPGQQFPDKVTIQIYWENSGAMRVVSPKGMRNMIVNILPYSKSG